MELIVKRIFDTHKNTAGILYCEGEPYCASIEDTFRHDKILHETRIPAGRYEINLRHGSPMAERYSRKYGTEGMIWIRNVPGFTYAYIHIGNDEDDSSGCILVGEKIITTIEAGTIDQALHNSTEIYLMVHSVIHSAIQSGEQVYITVLDN